VKNLIANAIEVVSIFYSKVRCIIALMKAGVGRYLDARMLQSYLLTAPGSANSLADSLKGSLNLLDVEQALIHSPVGSHLISPRKFYIHHGIHLGGGRIAHYAGYSGSFKPGPIEVTDYERFANGRSVWILQEQSEYSSDEIVSRAYSRIGEHHYKILSNNCEHFCSWCTRGKSYSVQVDALLHSPRGFFSMISALEPSLIA